MASRFPLPAGWRPTGPITAFLRSSGGVRYVEARHAGLVASALAAFDREAAVALLRAAKAKPVSLAGDPLVELGKATELKQVRHPLARAAIADVQAAIRTKVPTRWKPYPYQIIGAAFARLTGYRAFIADEMGLGKSLGALLCLAVSPELLPAVVVGPANIFTNWQDEAAKWLPTLAVWPLPTRRSPLPPPGWKGIIISKYSVIEGQSARLAKFGVRCLIVDEAHRIKDPAAQQTIGTRAVARAAPRRILLSGTPLKNNVLELCSLLGAMDEATEDEEAFSDTYAETEEKHGRTKITGAKNVDALRERLRHVMVRRLKSQVAAWLPAKTRQYIPVEAPEALMAEYRKAEKEFAAWLKAEMARRVEEMGGDPEEAEEKARKALSAAAAVKFGYLRRIVGRMKIEAAIEGIRDCVDAGIPLIAFGVHQDVLRGVLGGLGGVRAALIDGSTSPIARGKIVKAFQDGELDVVLGSEAMKEGVNLTRASYVMLIERMLTPADEEQAEDRAHRIGTLNPVTVGILQVLGTLDERLRDINDGKRGIIDAVIGGVKVAEGVSTVAALIAGYTKPAAPTTAEAKKKRGITRSQVLVLVFDDGVWNERDAGSWLRANGFPGARAVAGKGTYVARIRTTRGKTRVVRVTQGLRAIVATR